MVICGVVRRDGDLRSLPSLSDVSANLRAHGHVTRAIEIATPGLVARVIEHHPDAGDVGAGPERRVEVLGDVRLDDSRLRAELGLPSGRSDTDVVGAAYGRWGAACLGRLHGRFAVAIVDRDRPEILLAVDHAAQRSLAVFERDGLLAFASQALALTGLEPVGHEPDLEHAANDLARLRSDGTFVAGVRMLAAGSAIAVSPAGVRRWRWWEPERIGLRDLGSLDAHAAEMREQLDAAIAATLRDASRAGVTLSGGLDSTAVAATVARARDPESVPTYTSVPPAGWVPVSANPRRDPDEGPFVRALAAAHPNLAPRLVDVAGRNLFEGHEALWELGAPPIRNTLNLLWLQAIFEDAWIDGVDVLLTGERGNLGFSADGPRVLVELARRGRVGRLRAEARARARATGTGVPRVLRRELLRPAAPEWVLARRARGRPDPVTTWLERSPLTSEREAALDVRGAVPLLAARDQTGWAREVRQRFIGAGAWAEYAQAALTWWGLDLRSPLAGRALLEAAFAQPEWWRRHDGVERAIARRAMADRVPPEIVHRTRRGAQLPDWFDRLTEIRGTIEAEFEAMRDHPASRSLIDVGAVGAMIRSWPERTDAASTAAISRYNLALTRALFVSRYLRWFEGRGRRVAAGGARVALPVR